MPAEHTSIVLPGKLTQGVFAIIVNDEGKVLIKRRTDANQHWDLPGGGVDDGESDIAALVREVTEETGMNTLAVYGKVGPQLPFHNQNTGAIDIAQAYLVQTEGSPTPQAEASHFMWVDKNTAFHMIRDRPEDKTIVGPEGRVGRTPRMILDGLAIQGEGEHAELGTTFHGYVPDSCGTHLIERSHDNARRYKRFDPFTETGFVEAAS